MKTPSHMQRRWMIRAYLTDGSTALYPAMQIKREARADAITIWLTHEEYDAVQVTDAYEEIADKETDRIGGFLAAESEERLAAL